MGTVRLHTPKVSHISYSSHPQNPITTTFKKWSEEAIPVFQRRPFEGCYFFDAFIYKVDNFEPLEDDDEGLEG